MAIFKSQAFFASLIFLICHINLVGCNNTGGSDNGFVCIGSDVDCVTQLAGDYEGTYAGDTSGNWQATIATDGSITGSLRNTSTGDSYQLNGTVSADGEITMGVVSDGTSFTGEISTSGGVLGHWKSGSYGGTWVGKRTSATDQSNADELAATASSAQCDDCLSTRCDTYDACSALTGCIEMVTCLPVCDSEDNACLTSCFFASGAASDVMTSDAFMDTYICSMTYCPNDCSASASGDANNGDTEGVDLSEDGDTTSEDSCTLNDCVGNSTGFEIDYSCATGNSETVTNYNYAGSTRTGGTLTTTYTNGHTVSCSFSNGSIISGNCSDDTGSSCRF